MAKTDDTNKFLSIGSLFTTGEIKRMKDIEKLFPTLVAKSLGMNHSRYIQKLYHPEQFSLEQIISLANLFEINPALIIQVIMLQPNISKLIKNKKA